MLADAQGRYDDAVMYAADLLTALDEDFGTGIKERIASGVYTT